MTPTPVVRGQGRYIDVSPQYPANAVDPGLTPKVAPIYTAKPGTLYKDGSTYFIIYSFGGGGPRNPELVARGYTYHSSYGWIRRFSWHAPEGWITERFTSPQHDGYVHWNPESNEIYVTSGPDRHGERLTGPTAASVLAHARNTLFRT